MNYKFEYKNKTYIAKPTVMYFGSILLNIVREGEYEECFVTSIDKNGKTDRSDILLNDVDGELFDSEFLEFYMLNFFPKHKELAIRDVEKHYEMLGIKRKLP